jgi:glycine cleavage system H protein
MVLILVIATVLGLLLADLAARFLLHGRRGAQEALPAPPSITPLPDGPFRWRVEAPEGVFLSPRHAWAILEPDGMVRIGMDDFVRQMLGDIDSLDLPALQTPLRKGEPAVTLFKGHRLARLTAPLSGVVEEVHNLVAVDPQAIARDPYGEGWLFKVRPSSLAHELKGLVVAEEAKRFLDSEVERFRNFAQPFRAGLAADGGKPVAGIVPALGSEAWDEFRREFLGEGL